MPFSDVSKGLSVVALKDVACEAVLGPGHAPLPSPGRATSRDKGGGRCAPSQVVVTDPGCPPPPPLEAKGSHALSGWLIAATVTKGTATPWPSSPRRPLQSPMAVTTAQVEGEAA